MDIEEYVDVKSNPAIIFNRFYDIFFAFVTKHPILCTRNVLCIAYVTFSGDTTGCNINRICDLREKLEVLIREGKCAGDLEEVIRARDLADGVTSHIPYTGMTLFTYCDIRSYIPYDIRKRVYGEISERSSVNASKNALFDRSYKFIIGNPL